MISFLSLRTSKDSIFPKPITCYKLFFPFLTANWLQQGIPCLRLFETILIIGSQSTYLLLQLHTLHETSEGMKERPKGLGISYKKSFKTEFSDWAFKCQPQLMAGICVSCLELPRMVACPAALLFQLAAFNLSQEPNQEPKVLCYKNGVQKQF